MKNFVCTITLICCGFISSANTNLPALAVKREVTNINKDWKYLENNTRSLAVANNATGWQSINLPHSWNALDATDLTPGYRRDSSWYQKILDINTVEKDAVYELYFEGSNIVTEVFVNGKLVGGHIGGYIGFTIDISKAVKQGNNTVMVRVDNGFDPEIIPSQKSDFTIFGGITRDVWLVKKPLNHIKKIHITPTNVSAKKAGITVKTWFSNAASHKGSITVMDPSGKKVMTKKFSNSSDMESVDLGTINNPKLWDTENPFLYTVTVTLDNDDSISDKTGLRFFEFKDYGAFFLNGKRLLLRGTHRHEEHAGVGAAMSNEQHRADMNLIKEMGTNFVRLAHYPQDPEIYKACDELGIIVWDELPWCRGGVGNDVWQKNTKAMLEEIIDQNYNHPSIVFWSLGNEMYWLPDFEDGDNPVKLNAFLTELNDMAKKLDPTRVTAIRKYYEGAEIVDVFSPSIWSGWYSGSYKSYAKAIEQYKAQYKHFIHTEYGGSSHVGRHTEKPITGEGKIQAEGWEEAIVQTDVANIAQIGDWSENYIVDLFDWHLRISELDDTFIGNAQWAFKDFATPLRPDNDIPYMNQKGLVDREGNPKDAFYVFKSYWSNDPFAYIESHTWTERQGLKGESRTVSVYSNAPELEFFHNGKSLGKKKRDPKLFPAAGYTWDVMFESGENTFKALGKSKDGKKVEDNLVVNYRFEINSKPVKLDLEYKKLDNGNYLVTAIAKDSKGLRCLDYEDRVYFQCLSGGKALISQGTPTGSESIKMANGKASIQVKPEDAQTAIEVMTLNQDFKGTYLTIKQ